MNLTRFKLGHLGLAAVAAFAVSAASAAPVNSWNYSVSSSFSTIAADTVFGPSSGAAGTGGGTTSVGAGQISWGGPGLVGIGDPAIYNRSALTITNSPATGTGVALGQVNAANTYSHTNNTNLPYQDPQTLRATVINASITLTSSLGNIGPVQADYKVKFRETTNTAGTCPVPGGTPCSDLFVLDGSTNFGFNGGDGYFYTVTFTSSPTLGLLGGAANNAAACAAAGAPVGCLGYVTAENAVTDVAFSFVINATEIPEPASIALLGVGLLGLAGIRRRQQKNKA